MLLRTTGWFTANYTSRLARMFFSAINMYRRCGPANGRAKRWSVGEWLGRQAPAW